MPLKKIHILRFVAGAALTVLSSLSAAAPVKAQAYDAVFVNPGFKGEVFWDMVVGSMLAAAEDVDGRIEVLYAERDKFRMRALAREVIDRAEPPEFLILVNEERSVAETLPAAEAAGIRTLLLLNSVTDSDRVAIGAPGERLKGWIGAIIPDNHAAGARMARLGIQAARDLGLTDAEGRVHVFALGGDRTTPAAIERQSGMAETIEADPFAKLERLFFARWRREAARELTERFYDHLRRGDPRPGLIWCANDEIAEGAAEALRARGLEPGRDAVLVGLNWSAEGLAMVRDGAMQLTDGGHFFAGAWAAVALRDVKAGGSLAPYRPALRFDMQSIDAPSERALPEGFPLSSLRSIDYSRFSRAMNGDAALPMRLSEILRLAAEASQ